MDDFLWRVSLAEISRAGSFSAFPSVDRTIMLWQGEGLVLRSPSWGARTLDAALEPFEFRGEDDVWCELIGGTTTDLNLMVRRCELQGTLFTCCTGTNFSGAIEEVVILCAKGSIQVLAGGRDVSLSAGEFLRVLRSSVAVEVATPHSLFVCAVIRLDE